ncbi:MAG: UbiA family prenyltransferase [Thermoproteota archaeon]|nr:UbiA family prenyltransferase [Thermoproteota archaeon]
MQHNVSQRLKEYLLLIRLPNIFTVPSNILTGYFASVPVVEADSVQLIALTVSSALLYVGGIVLNDYFDIEIDKRERPFRPLPSGKISKRDALAIAMVAILIANSIALVLGPTSLAVSLILTFAIILYDYRLKHGFSGPFAMGGARFLNVIFGASPVLLYLDNHSRAIVLAAAGSLFLYIMAITFLSKKEAGNERANSTIVLLMVFGVISAVAILGFLLQLSWALLLNLSLFAAVMVVTFKRHLTKELLSVQKAVRNMVISIIILDSIFITGTAGLAYGLATLLLIAPAIVLAKKLYVT